MTENKKDLMPEELLKQTPAYPERAAEGSSHRPQAEGVYAGPEMPVAMVTYAGPNMMNGFVPQGLFSGIPAPQPQPEPAVLPQDTSGQRQCKGCGFWNPASARFCSECGRQLARPTESQKTS